MAKINNLIQKISHSPKLLLLAGAIVFLLIYLVLLFLPSKPLVQKPGTQITPTPSLQTGPILVKEPFPTPSLSINWSDQSLAVPEKLDIYSISQPLINPRIADLIAQKLGFTSDSEQESIDENLRIWSKDKRTLLLNFQNNSMFYDSGIPLSASTEAVSPANSLFAAKSYLQNIFGVEFNQSLIDQGVSYFESDSVPSTPTKADLIRTSFYQSINNYPLATLSQTGGIITLFLDKNLSISSLVIKNAYSKADSLGSFATTPLSELISNSNSYAQRINSSDNLDISVETVSASKIIFNQATVKLAYLSKDGQLIPVYLLEGSIATSSTPNQFALYVLPTIMK